MKILNDGSPSVTKSKERYIKAIKEMGFEAAHLQMLNELFLHYGSGGAKRADIIEGGFSWIAQELVDLPPISERDKLFTQVFGQAGQAIIDEEQARADKDVDDFMKETGITDERQARKMLVGGMIQAMGDWVKQQKAKGN